MSEPALLDDEQVREFIVNGFVRLTPDVPLALHDEIDAALRRMMEEESRYHAELLAGIPQAQRERLGQGIVPRRGNDVLARVPELRRVLNCAVVRGAVASIVGPDYCLHPHRAVHDNTPLADADEPLAADANAPRLGVGSRVNSAWHQDAHSPLARARHHLPRYLIGYYFPHETPVAMGPTRIQAGSHLYPGTASDEALAPARVHDALLEHRRRAVRSVSFGRHDDHGRLESFAAGEREIKQRPTLLFRQKVRHAHERHRLFGWRRLFALRRRLPAQDGRQARSLRVVRVRRDDAHVAVERLAQLAEPSIDVAEPTQRRHVVGLGCHGALEHCRRSIEQAIRTQASRVSGSLRPPPAIVVPPGCSLLGGKCSSDDMHGSNPAQRRPAAGAGTRGRVGKRGCAVPWRTRVRQPAPEREARRIRREPWSNTA